MRELECCEYQISTVHDFCTKISYKNTKSDQGLMATLLTRTKRIHFHCSEIADSSLCLYIRWENRKFAGMWAKICTRYIAVVVQCLPIGPALCAVQMLGTRDRALSASSLNMSREKKTKFSLGSRLRNKIRSTASLGRRSSASSNDSQSQCDVKARWVNENLSHDRKLSALLIQAEADVSEWLSEEWKYEM
jgi:hypothetical protein